MEEDFESDEESEATLPPIRKKEFPKWKKNYKFDKTILLMTTALGRY